MSLDARIKKLARGLTAREAADAYAQSLDDPESLRDDQRAQAAEFEATIEAMFLMAAVDGEISEAELAQLAASVQAMYEVSGRGKRMDTGRLLGDLNHRLGKEGWKVRLDSVAARLRTPESRSFAFRLAAGVAFVDDVVAHAEAAAIDAFAAAFSLTPDESHEILSDVRETLFG